MIRYRINSYDDDSPSAYNFESINDDAAIGAVSYSYRKDPDEFESIGIKRIVRLNPDKTEIIIWPKP